MFEKSVVDSCLSKFIHADEAVFLMIQPSSTRLGSSFQFYKVLDDVYLDRYLGCLAYNERQVRNVTDARNMSERAMRACRLHEHWPSRLDSHLA